MDFSFSAEENAFRKEVRAFLDAELPEDKAFNHEFNEDAELWKFAFEFTRKVGEKGWIGLTWPTEYGRGHRRAEAPLPPGHLPLRRLLGRGPDRARLRLGPGVAVHPGRA